MQALAGTLLLALALPAAGQDVIKQPAKGGRSPLPRLKVSDNKRFLVTADGKPFFYLGDTAWELFHRLNRDDADLYLRDRAAKRFTVIQAVVLAEFAGLTEPNALGHLPLTNNDPTKPNEDYFRDVDWVVNRAEELGPAGMNAAGSPPPAMNAVRASVHARAAPTSVPSPDHRRPPGMGAVLVSSKAPLTATPIGRPVTGEGTLMSRRPPRARCPRCAPAASGSARAGC